MQTPVSTGPIAWQWFLGAARKTFLIVPLITSWHRVLVSRSDKSARCCLRVRVTLVAIIRSKLIVTRF